MTRDQRPATRVGAVKWTSTYLNAYTHGRQEAKERELSILVEGCGVVDNVLAKAPVFCARGQR